MSLQPCTTRSVIVKLIRQVQGMYGLQASNLTKLNISFKCCRLCVCDVRQQTVGIECHKEHASLTDHGGKNNKVQWGHHKGGNPIIGPTKGLRGNHACTMWVATNLMLRFIKHMLMKIKMLAFLNILNIFWINFSLYWMFLNDIKIVCLEILRIERLL